MIHVELDDFYGHVVGGNRQVQQVVTHYDTGTQQMKFKYLIVTLTVIASGCGSIVEPPPPCTPENATSMAYDHKDRLIAYTCDF